MVSHDSRDRKIRRNGMYRETFRLTLKLYPYVLFIILCAFSAEIIGEIVGMSPGYMPTITYFLWAILAYLTCLHIYLRPTDKGPLDTPSLLNIRNFASFFWRLTFLMFPICILDFVLFFIGGRTVRYVFHELGQPRWQAIGETVLKIYLFEYIVFLLLFSVFGLMLTTIVADGKRGFKASYKRAVSQFSGVLGRLIIGPILLHFIGVALHTAVVIGEPAATSLLFDGWIPNIIGIALFLMQSALWAWAVVMTFWILSKAYLKAEYGAKGMQVVHRF